MDALWIDLPVRDVEVSRNFFRTIGFRENNNCPDPSIGSFFVGNQDVVIMLNPLERFKQYVATEVADPKQGTQVLLNISARTKADVDEMAEKVRQGGGSIFSQPQEWESWMYGLGFADPDGHRWICLYMDAPPNKNNHQ